MKNSLTELKAMMFDQIRAIQDTALDDKDRKMRANEGLVIAKLGDEIIKASALQLKAVCEKNKLEDSYGYDEQEYGLKAIACD